MKLHSLLIAAVGIVFLSGCSKSPETTVESFYYALSKGEITEAKGYLSTQLAAKVGDAKIATALTQEATRIDKCGGLTSVVVKLSGQGEIRNGTVDLTFGSESCKPKSQKTALVMEDGSWKISASK